MLIFIPLLFLFIPIMKFIEKKDETYRVKKKTDIIPLITSICGYLAFVISCGSLTESLLDFPAGIILGISFAFLLCAAICDNRTTQIYDILYAPPVLLGLGYGLFIRRNELPEALYGYIGIAVFIVFQLLILSRFYGLSDSLAYSAIAVVGTAVRATEWSVLACMVTSFAVFVIIQAVCKNIGKNLKLKEQKALIPYIVASYWPTLFLLKLF